MVSVSGSAVGWGEPQPSVKGGRSGYNIEILYEDAFIDANNVILCYSIPYLFSVHYGY